MELESQDEYSPVLILASILLALNTDPSSYEFSQEGFRLEKLRHVFPHVLEVSGHVGLGIGQHADILLSPLRSEKNQRLTINQPLSSLKEH